MAVLHQAMADEAELGFLARPLAVEPCIGIRRRDMRLVRPLLAMEIGFGIAPATGRRLVRSVPWLKALQRSPRFDQGPSDRDVIGGWRISCPRPINTRWMERSGDIPFEQPVAVL